MPPHEEKRKNLRLRQYIKELEFRNQILQAQQELSLDGILVVDENWKMVSFNNRFVSMWGIPNDILEMRDDRKSIQTVLDKLKYPDAFLKRVEQLMQNPAELSQDELQLKDGRFFDRYSAPIYDKKNNLKGRVWFFRDITELKNVTKKRQRQNEELEKCVIERTKKLKKVNDDLKTREEELQESNVALRTLIHAVEQEKRLLEKKVATNFEYAILPLLSDLQDVANSSRQRTLLDSIHFLIQNLSDGINIHLVNAQCQLTPTEIKIANLLKQGKTTKDIACALSCAKRTVDGHRASIRKKLGLNRGQNLQTAILTLDTPDTLSRGTSNPV